jgi:hypothetical protein
MMPKLPLVSPVVPPVHTRQFVASSRSHLDRTRSHGLAMTDVPAAIRWYGFPIGVMIPQGIHDGGAA